MAKSRNRIQVILECTEHKTSGQPGTSRYITTKNKKNTTERLELKKFNSIYPDLRIAQFTLSNKLDNDATISMFRDLNSNQ